IRDLIVTGVQTCALPIFLVRTCVDRLAQDAGTTVAAEMNKARVKGQHRIQARNKLGESYEAELDIKFEQLQVLPPEAKWKDYTRSEERRVGKECRAQWRA